MPRKPAPDSVLLALEKLGGCPVDKALYIGDSDVDIETARNSGIKCISASWGFKDREVLERLNPGAIIDAPAELYNYL